MGKFFHGWRRKAGCVLLIVAAILTLAWIRGFYIDELIVSYNAAVSEGYPISMFANTFVIVTVQSA